MAEDTALRDLLDELPTPGTRFEGTVHGIHDPLQRSNFEQHLQRSYAEDATRRDPDVFLPHVPELAHHAAAFEELEPVDPVDHHGDHLTHVADHDAQVGVPLEKTGRVQLDDVQTELLVPTPGAGHQPLGRRLFVVALEPRPHQFVTRGRRVYVDWHVQLLGRGEDDPVLFVVVVRHVAVREVAVDHGADEPEFRDGPLELRGRPAGVFHGQSREAGESPVGAAHDLGRLIVGLGAPFGVLVAHPRELGEHLDGDVALVHVGQATRRLVQQTCAHVGKSLPYLGVEWRFVADTEKGAVLFERDDRGGETWWCGRTPWRHGLSDWFVLFLLLA